MLIAALSIALQTAPASGTWEKLLAPGVTYHMQIAPGPMLVNAVRVTPEAQGVLMSGELATGRVYDSTASLGRETVTAMALRTKALVTVNADFFPYTGDPLGAMVREGELLSSPQRGRAAFCWGPGFSHAAYLTFDASLRFENQTHSIFGVNQECGDNMIVLNTPQARLASSREPARHIVLVSADTLTASGTWKPKVRRLVDSSTSVAINDDEWVLTYRGSPAEKFTFLSPGDEIEIKTDCKGTDWQKATNAIGGGPFLVRDGKAYIPFGAEGFSAGFANNRHPRTAIGRTAAGDLWIVTIDGRQTMSVGATLAEAANVMLSLGCVDAINLDGGGSTTMNIGSVTVNRPSEGSERAIANAVLVFSSFVAASATPVAAANPVLAGKASLKVGESARYRFIGGAGTELPDTDVVWSAQGSGWIDQSGTLRASKEGPCRILAVAQGQTASLTVTVTPR